ncbi:MAG TPA: nickel pincer cofactor biosynthesis protein LarC [Nitrosopumilaceae archaeon]|nr:nickel pincer cofactor biosynthesis protein LarC [Nitrosopumilaceae archaeon]
MVIVIDSQIAGISGDMLLCALVDLGANKLKIIKAIKISEKNMSGSIIKKIDFCKVKKNGVEATELILDIDEKTHERKGTEIQKCIEKSINEIGLSEKAKSFAIASIETLMKAESKIHGSPISSVHFHEASSIDTVIDIIGTATAIDDLKLFAEEFISTQVAVGGGTLTFSHGTTSNPASAVLEILKNSQIMISGGQVNEELTTPTGASMLTNLTKTCLDFYPKMRVNSIGYGAGKKNFDGFSNVLKIIQGEKTKFYHQDVVQILETNVDDVSGELLGNLIEKIMSFGAKDVTITSAITKKGRPTNLVSVICDSESMNSIIELLISETGTLGIRVRSSERYTVPRTVEKIPIKIEGLIFEVNCKIVYEENKIKNFKIEYDDIVLISKTINQSFKKTEELIRIAVKDNLGLK